MPLPQGVSFSLEYPTIVDFWGAHSGSQALANGYSAANEFHSAGTPLVMEFQYIQDFIGVFVGSNEVENSEYIATLTAYGEDEEGNSIVVGTASETLSAAINPIDTCLWVEAPGKIVKATLNYGPGASVGASELIDDLILRGPETPMPVPEDDAPPVVTIEDPTEGKVVMEAFTRLEGEISENRGLERVELWVNDAFSKEIGAAWMGLTQYWFLDAVDDADLSVCEENIVEVRAFDTAGNEGRDQVTIYYVGPGDLEIVSVDAVQVVYDAALVKGKTTAFRATVNSTFSCEISAHFQLELPDDQWVSSPPSTGRLITGAPPSWSYPELWGPVSIPAGASGFEVMLPYIPPGGEGEGFGLLDHPAGIIFNRESGGIFGPDVRVAPRPIRDSATFEVMIDPEDEISESDETNNRRASGSLPVVNTKSWKILIVPYKSGTCAPRSGTLNAKDQIEYLLGTFPIADSKISYGFAGASTEACAADPSATCMWTLTWGEEESRGAFLDRVARLALASGYDFGLAVGCGSGGGANRGFGGAVFIGQSAGQSASAHEFNHAMTAVRDTYSLDCLVAWDEAYCEFPDGSRIYACYLDMDRPDGYTATNCALDAASELVCEEQTKHCEIFVGCSIYRNDWGPGCQEVDEEGEYVIDACNAACARERLAEFCDGGRIYGGPDGRVRHPASEGFWVNRWVAVDSSNNYFMDIPGGPTFPRHWMRLENISHHCDEEVFSDGYLNLLRSDRFLSPVDPEVILVSGLLSKAGPARFDPFIILAEAPMDIAPGKEGAYRFDLLDGNGNLLSTSGFNVSFYQSDPNAGPVNEAPFAFRIEWKEGTERIELRDAQGNLLASRNLSQHEPQVTLEFPNGSDTLWIGKAAKVRWKASDGDGDPLSFFLELSRDAGETWIPLAIDVGGNSYELDTSGLYEGDQYLLRIKVTDGMRTSEDISDGAFRVQVRMTPSIPWGWIIGFGVLLMIGIVLIIAGVCMARRRTAK